MALEYTHPLTEMSTKKCFWVVEHYWGRWMGCLCEYMGGLICIQRCV
jgi:hypothetical protein